MHVECALVSFVGGGAVPGKRQDWHRSALPPERIIQVSIIIIIIFFFFFVTQSGSDAATCHWARWSTGHNLVWKKEKKIPFHLHMDMTRKYIDFYTYVCVCIYMHKYLMTIMVMTDFFFYNYIEMDFSFFLFFSNFPPPPAEGVQLCRCIHITAQWILYRKMVNNAK